MSVDSRKPERGLLVWATVEAGPPVELVSSVAGEFNLEVRFCTHDEVLDVLRSERCAIIGVEFGADPRPGIDIIKKLHERAPHLTILAASTDMNVTVLRVALDSGANDVLSLPLSAPELHKALIRFSRPKNGASAREAGKIVTIYGVRGGLGTTTIAVNLAIQLREACDADVALVDLDLQRGDVAAFLNVTPVNSLAAMVGAPAPIDEIFLAGILTRHSSGIFLLPAPPQMEEADAIGHGEVQAALTLLRSQFRFSIVDTGRMIGGPTLATFENSDETFLVTDLSVPGVRAARRVIELLLRLGLPRERTHLIVTQAIPGAVGLPEAARAIGRDPLIVIPRDAAAGVAMNAGTPLETGGGSPLAAALADLARRVAGLEPLAKPKRAHIFQRIFQREERV